MSKKQVIFPLPRSAVLFFFSHFVAHFLDKQLFLFTCKYFSWDYDKQQQNITITAIKLVRY